MNKILLKMENIKPFPSICYFNYNFFFDEKFIDTYKIELIKSTYYGLGKSEIIKSQNSNEKIIIYISNFKDNSQETI